MNLHEKKKQLRSYMLNKRRFISFERMAIWNERISDHFQDWPIYLSCKTIMFYLAMPEEVQTLSLIMDSLRRGKQVYVPLLGERRGEMSAAEVTSLDDLVIGKYGLKMPNPEKAKFVLPASINMVVVPAVAFDRKGNRLGLGAGYYDRFLPEAIDSILIGMAWECQLIDELPNEAHDVRMHYLLTENGLIFCR